MSKITGSEVKDLMEAYQSIYSYDNIELDEQQSDVSKQWEKGAKWIGKATDKYFANPVSGAVRTAADYAGSAISGITKAATGGSVDLEKIGRSAEKVLSFGSGKPPTTKTRTTPTPSQSQSQDLGKKLGQWLVPPPEKSADPDVRSGKRTPTGTPSVKPSTTKSAPVVKRDPRGAVIVNHLEIENDNLVTEAPAQVAPITGKQGKGWYQKSSKTGKWVPITDPQAAKVASERWKQQRLINRPPSEQRGVPVAQWERNPSTSPRQTPSGSRQQPAAPSARPSTLRTTTAARPSAPAPRPVTPKIEKSPAGYAVGTTQGVKFERRAATRAELEAAQAARKAALEAGKSKAEVEKSAIAAGVTASKKSSMKEAFDIVLDYLFSEGHVDTLDEALYVMMEMDAETIVDIVEGDPSFQIKRSTGAGALTPSAAAQLGPKAVELQKKKAAGVDLPNLKQSPSSMAQGV